MIFQDPYASLNPRMNVAQIVGEALRFMIWLAVTKRSRESMTSYSALVSTPTSPTGIRTSSLAVSDSGSALPALSLSIPS